MPIYDYKCRTCGSRFQLVRKITDDSLPQCKECGSNDTEKLISPSAFVLKGSGWYLTDYSNKNKAPAGDSASSTASDSGGASSAPANSSSSD